MSNTDNLDLKLNDGISIPVGEYIFEPIKGYPMLNWRGKRPFRSTQYYPAQLKEQHGNAVNGWINKIFWGDNIQVMSHLLKEFRGKVDLIYIDPPFDSKADYKKKIKLKGKITTNDQTIFEEKQYTDIWSNDEYLQFMYERLILLKELLSETGSVFMHCDYRKNHYLRCILDEVFGADNFVNEIVICYTGPTNQKKNFPRKHDTIFWYKKSLNYTFNIDEARIDYVKSNKSTGKTSLAGRADDSYLEELDEAGKVIEDYWTDIRSGSHIPKQVRDYGDSYPTLKDTRILERIISVCSNKGDLILDTFMGSGTTQSVAMELGRRFIGADINLGAIQTTTKRLIKIAEDIEASSSKSNDIVNYYKGFEVYNVNNYDIFRNPVQAKELLIEALEIQSIRNSVYDGEKDGRMVKIMPVNHIATKQDAQDLISGVDYKAFEKRKDDKPNQPVEKLLIICMGHEPDLAAYIEQSIGYKLDIQVVDILRDRTDLEFKRDSEALIEVSDSELVIESFYPLNLMQKLSMMKENVSDWRELVENIMIDWNYDGAVFQPQLTDIPDKKELVSGSYSIPSEAGTIRVKITDLLSETLEISLVEGVDYHG
ncbi:site-specific DNA-methyltransferase [Psychrobacter namhaensis]|uniref:site-specific DNA-methyltransferase (adenine-specific) n=1 Tax=Psychrobacter namhaensis TaxID=292734 RepID=A0ABW8LB04_9GAMM